MFNIVRFDVYEIDVTAGQLYRRGTRVPLRDQAFQVLAALVERPRQVVTRDELRHRLWPHEVFVDFDNALNGAVARLREALRDSADHPRFIETIPRRGYRFIAPVSAPGPLADPAPAIAGAIDVTTRSGERAGGATEAPKGSTRNPIAYNEYVRGRHYLDHAIHFFKGLREAREHLEKAVALDPGFARAYEALAQLYWLLGYAGSMPPRDAFAAGILYALRSVEIDNTRAETYALVAQYHKQLDYNWPDIERQLTRALELDPASPFVRMLYAVSWLMPQGRIQDAIAELERALERDPLSWQLHHWHCVMFVLARDWDRALEKAHLLVELEPGVAFGPWLMGGAYRGKGLLEESIAAHRKAVQLSGGAAMMLGWLGLVLGASGRTDEARGVLERLETMARTGYVPPTSIAWVYLGVRDVDRGFEWLDRAIDARDQFMMPIKSYAFFDPIRADPRFAALLRKMNLER